MPVFSPDHQTQTLLFIINKPFSPPHLSTQVWSICKHRHLRLARFVSAILFTDCPFFGITFCFFFFFFPLCWTQIPSMDAAHLPHNPSESVGSEVEALRGSSRGEHSYHEQSAHSIALTSSGMCTHDVIMTSCWNGYLFRRWWEGIHDVVMTSFWTG